MMAQFRTKETPLHLKSRRTSSLSSLPWDLSEAMRSIASAADPEQLSSTPTGNYSVSTMIPLFLNIPKTFHIEFELVLLGLKDKVQRRFCFLELGIFKCFIIVRLLDKLLLKLFVNFVNVRVGFSPPCAKVTTKHFTISLLSQSTSRLFG